MEGKKSQALVIENAPLGVQAARAAGLICLAITSNNSAVRLNKASLVFDSLDEMRILLEDEYQSTQGKGNWQFLQEIKND